MLNPSRILFLVRHAKSSWKDLPLADHDRPLKKRGYKNAILMGRRLKKRPRQPDVIVSSSALRALTTAEILAPYLDMDPDKVIVNPSIYGSSGRKMINIIERFDDRFAAVMVVGHNPEITRLANKFGGEPIANVPTCGMVVIRFETNQWAAVSSAPSTLLEFDYPKKEP